MPEIIAWVNLTIGVAVVLFLWYGALVSVREGENRAAGRLFIVSAVVFLIYAILFYKTFPFREDVHIAFFVISILFLVLLFFPYPGSKELPGNPPRNVDERDTMFSRNELIPGTERYENYYVSRPDHLLPDRKFREKPGLLQHGTSQYYPIFFCISPDQF